ncbi:unnamed protein product [Polarella glacialis]|uniref:Uncharacterized protein n=1 Tax=Polarella glacialis TaxID=89957 RepID=A0A813EX97_POLGL|nr:unnamed protein product [Polarella glacialis]
MDDRIFLQYGATQQSQEPAFNHELNTSLRVCQQQNRSPLARPAAFSNKKTIYTKCHQAPGGITLHSEASAASQEAGPQGIEVTRENRIQARKAGQKQATVNKGKTNLKAIY